jgi:hypothetical protein
MVTPWNYDGAHRECRMALSWTRVVLFQWEITAFIAPCNLLKFSFLRPSPAPAESAWPTCWKAFQQYVGHKNGVNRVGTL